MTDTVCVSRTIRRELAQPTVELHPTPTFSTLFWYRAVRDFSRLNLAKTLYFRGRFGVLPPGFSYALRFC